MLTEESVEKAYYNYIKVGGEIFVDPLFILKDLGKDYFQELIDDPMQQVSVKGDDVFVELHGLKSFLTIDMMNSMSIKLGQTEAIKLLRPILTRLDQIK